MPQPRITNRVSFLFSNTYEYWEQKDKENEEKSKLDILNRNGKPFKPTRYAYRLKRLQAINDYRENIYNTVMADTNGDIPKTNLFVFFLFHTPKNLSKKKKKQLAWTLHDKRPDKSNLTKSLEDALYVEDKEVNSWGIYKLIVPDEIPEGIVILENSEIHNFVINELVEMFTSKTLN